MTTALSRLSALAACVLAACTNAAPSPSAARASSVGCPAGQDAGDAYNPLLVASDFSSTIDNPYFPLVPGSVMVSKDLDGNVDEMTVTADVRVVFGVTCRVVHDVARSPAGVVLEDTWDWFAQDKDGSVWYFGEDTKAFSGASVSTSGSWETGVGCARPGVVMEAHPTPGDRYRQEYRPGVAEDRAEILRLHESVTVAQGSYRDCVVTRETSDLEPGVEEQKSYCPGVGEVASDDLTGGRTTGHEELTSLRAP